MDDISCLTVSRGMGHSEPPRYTWRDFAALTAVNFLYLYVPGNPMLHRIDTRSCVT
jgi:hypothetical protein